MFFLKQREKKRNERVATSSICAQATTMLWFGCMDSWKSYSRTCWPKGQRIEENFKWYSIAQVSENYSSIPVCWSGCAGEKCPSFPSRANVNKHHMVGEAGICPLPVLRKQLQPVSLLCVYVTSLPKAQQASWEQKPPSTSLERHPESGQVLFSKCGWRRCSCDTNSLPLSSSYWTDAQQKEMMSSFQWISTEARPYIHGHSFLPKSLQPFCCHHPHALWHRPLTSFSSKLFRIPSEAGKNGNACPHLIM